MWNRIWLHRCRSERSLYNKKEFCWVVFFLILFYKIHYCQNISWILSGCRTIRVLIGPDLSRNCLQRLSSLPGSALRTHCWIARLAASLAISTSVLKALPVNLILKDTHLVFSIYTPEHLNEVTVFAINISPSTTNINKSWFSASFSDQ